MASLTDQTIGSTYTLLLKLDSSAVDGNLQKIESGIGTDTALSISTNAIAIDAADKLGFDGTNSGTYITESADGILDIYVDAVRTLILKEDGGNSKVGIGKVPVDGILEVKGQTASSPVISVDGSATNGFIMMADNYSTGESQYSTGVTYSGAAAYIASRVHTATDQAYTHADGWKSSTDVAAYRGAAIVVDGNNASAGGGSISLYYGHSEGTVAPGSTKALTRGFILRYDGNVGIGTEFPTGKLHVVGMNYQEGIQRWGATGKTISSGAIDISANEGPIFAITAEGGSGSDDLDFITVDGGNPTDGMMIFLTKSSGTISLRMGENVGVTDGATAMQCVSNVGDTDAFGVTLDAAAITSCTFPNSYSIVQLIYKSSRWCIMGIEQMSNVRTDET